MNQIARTDDRMVAIENRINQQVSSAISVGTGGISFQNAGEVMEYAKMMAVSGSAVPKHLRGQPGACLGIIDDAIRFRTSPYALARKSYFVNDNLAYEAQVIAGVINAFAPLKQRPDIKWEGEGPDRVCIVIAEFKDGSVREVRSPKLKDIHPKNSPLWKSDPDQQQSYYTLRSFARRWCPEIILGIYDVEEMRSIDHRDDEPRQSLADRLSAAREGSAQEPAGPREGFDPDFVTRETDGLSAGTETCAEPSSIDTGDDAGGGKAEPSRPLAADPIPSEPNSDDETGEPAGEAPDCPDAADSPVDPTWIRTFAKIVVAGIGPDEADVVTVSKSLFKAGLTEDQRTKARSITNYARAVSRNEMERADAIDVIAGIAGMEAGELA